MAVRLGVVHVERDIKRDLTAKEFLKWRAYEELEPFGELRADYRAASIVAMIANVNRGSKDKAYTLDDVRLKFEEREEKPEQPRTEKQAQEHQHRALQLWAIAQAAVVAEDNPPK